MGLILYLLFQYFEGMGLDEDEKRERMKHCRHKARYIRPSTPEHYWSINFPDTQEAEARGKCNFLDIFVGFSRDRVPTGERTPCDHNFANFSDPSALFGAHICLVILRLKCDMVIIFYLRVL